MQFVVHDLLLAVLVPQTPKKERDEAQERLRKLCKCSHLNLFVILQLNLWFNMPETPLKS